MPDGKPITPRIRKRIKIINAVDLFCGAGGTSSGLIQAVNSLGYDINLVAINHWKVAIATHTLNHENVQHFCQAIETLNPTDIVKGGRLQLLVASPECTHHSNARGGKPRNDQKRADAWMLMRWIEKLYVENLLIENVPEFMDWGPLTAKGLPDKRSKGKYFDAFLAQLRINYTVEYKILNCADYGDPTTRKRFFLIAKRGLGKKIVWPERTHASRKELAKLAVQPGLFGGKELQAWVPAREIIDWSLQGKSIFGRKKAHSRNTIRRIFSGLKKYSNLNVQLSEPPIEVQAREFGERIAKKTMKARVLKNRPFKPFIGPMYAGEFKPKFNPPPEPGVIMLPWNIAELSPIAISDLVFAKTPLEPFTLVPERPLTNRSAPRDIEEPVATVTGTPRIGVVETDKFQINLKGTSRNDRPVDDPTFTQAAGGNHQGIVDPQPYVVKQYGESPDSRSHSVDETLGTVTANFNHFGLAEPEVVAPHDDFIFNMAHTGDSSDEARHAAYCRDTDEPVPTVAGKGMIGLVESDEVTPFLMSAGGPELPPKEVEEPVRSILTRDGQGLVETEFISAYHGGPDGDARNYSPDDPIPTLDTSNRYAVVKTSVEREPYIVPVNHGDDQRTHSLNEPVPTVTAFDALGVSEPSFIVPFFGERDGQEPRTRDIEEPAPTVTTHGRMGIVEPFTVRLKNNQGAQDVEEPLNALTTKESYGLAEGTLEPIVITACHGGDTNPAKPTSEPLGSVLGSNRFGVVEGGVEPFIVPQHTTPDTRDIGEPTPTLTTTSRGVGVAEGEAFILGQQSGSVARETDEPVPTIAGKGAVALVQPFIVKFYGNGDNTFGIDDTLATVTGKDRFALCIPEIGVFLDIRFRMLTPRELADAMSFPPEYQFTGNRENQVKQIGNAVPLRTARALTAAILMN